MGAARLAHSRVEIVPGIGHFGPLQQPVVVAGSILASVGSGSGTTPS
jgi:pimeloyl-ACP methyl ester carboxylesterase